MSLIEFGSETSLEVDESGSSTSGQESVDLPAPDDRERMSLLEAAVQWIKKEMNQLRESDRDIMQQLLKVHTTVRDIREHQSQVKQDLDSSCRGKGFGSSDSLEQILENEPDTERLAVRKEKSASALPVHKITTPPRLPPPSFEVNAPTHLKKDADDQVLCDFLGEEHMRKLSLLGKYQQESNTEPPQPQEKPKPNASSKVQKKSSSPSYGRSASASASMDYKTEAAQPEGPNSILFDIQKFRQELQMSTMKELAAFDEEMDVNLTPSIATDEDANGYRYSILKEMDEILGPTSSERRAGHLRQSSEPFIHSNVGREQGKRLYTQEEAARMGGYKVFAQVNNGQLPQSRTPPLGRSLQATPEQVYHSLRRPSKPKIEPTMTRTNSDGIPQVDSVTNQLSTQHGGGAMNAVPYDTGVVRKRRSLDKPRNPLQYSVESLNKGQEAENGGGSPSHSSGYALGEDDGIEHKRIGNHYKTDSLPNYSKSAKPKLQTKLSAPSWNQTSDAPSADVYPETSSPSHDIKPYMTTSQARTKMDQFLNRTEADKYVYKPYSQLKSQRSRPDSAPVRKHAVNVHSSNRTFL